ncbi:DODA-type extradiol aromatic ring-opening dioxygenase family protein [Abortiporus biennis]
MSSSTNITALPRTRVEWKKALDELPSTPDKIPVFFFGHGSPMLAFPENETSGGFSTVMDAMGPKGSLANFLLFSAHWETLKQRHVTDYGDENPLLMDYFGFQPSLYQLKFKSRGDSAVSQRVVEAFQEAGFVARTTTKLEARGDDGRGFRGPGLDHGVFVPFRLMFGEEFTDIPIVEASIDSTLDPEKNWAIGNAVQKLREEGVLILSGGLTIHNLRDFSCFSERTAGSLYKDFDKAILDAIAVDDPDTRKTALINLTKHQGFRAAQPRSDHFVPLYVAAGAGGKGDVKILSAIYGAPTFAFGL